jgi:hypothetical protein
MDIKTVIMIGAGGNLGSAVLSALLSSTFKVTILTRASSKSTFPDGVSVIEILDDYPDLVLLRAFHGQDAVVCTLPALNTSPEARMIRAAVQAGVKRFIPAEFGLETRNTESLALIPTMADKVAVLDELIAYESETFSWSAIATGVFFDWGIEHASHFLHYDIGACAALTLNGGETTFSATSLATIGTAVVRTLEREGLTRNRTIYIHSFTTTQNAIVAAFEKCTGHRWLVETQGEAAFIQTSQKKCHEGNVRGLFDIVFARGILHSNFIDMPGFANDLLGLDELSMEEEIRRIVGK